MNQARQHEACPLTLLPADIPGRIPWTTRNASLWTSAPSLSRARPATRRATSCRASTTCCAAAQAALRRMSDRSPAICPGGSLEPAPAVPCPGRRRRSPGRIHVPCPTRPPRRSSRAALCSPGRAACLPPLSQAAHQFPASHGTRCSAAAALPASSRVRASFCPAGPCSACAYCGLTLVEHMPVLAVNIF